MGTLPRGRTSSGLLELHCESPHAAGVRFHFDAIAIGGWALGPAPVERVVAVAGGREIELEHGLASADVAAAHPDRPYADRARFNAAIPTDGLPRGPQALVVRAVDANGHEAVAATEIEVQPFVDARDRPGSLEELAAAGEPLVICDSPRLFFADEAAPPVVANGWAWAPGGIERVIVVVDRRAARDAGLGLWRGDVARALGQPDAGASGWTVALPEHVCPEGEHELTVIAVARDGRAAGAVGTVRVVRGARPVGWDPGESAPVAAAPRERPLDEVDVPAAHHQSVLDVDRIARYRWAAPVVGGGAALDVGCGDGAGAEALLAAGASSVIGLDTDAEAVEAARARGLGGARFVTGDPRALPAGDRSFDVVCLLGGEIALADVFDELCRVVTSDGVIVAAGAGAGELLRTRFPHVREARQRTLIVSAVEEHDPAALPRVGGEPVEVAAASARPFRSLPAAVATAAPLAPQPWRDHAALWTERALRAEAEAEANTIDASWAQAHSQAALIQAGRTEEELELARRQIESVRASSSWRLTAPARAAAARLRALRDQGRRARSRTRQ